MKTMINIKTESSLKKEAQKVASELGLPLSVIVNNYLKEFVQERRVVFSKPLTPNKKTARLIKRAEKDIKEGKNLVSFNSAEDAIKYLHA